MTEHGITAIYRIVLPKADDAKAFVAFMREEYFPAVDKGSTRLGAVVSLRLLQDDPEPEAVVIPGREFFLHVRWSNNFKGRMRLTDAAVNEKFDSFGGSLELVAWYLEKAAWSEDDAV